MPKNPTYEQKARVENLASGYPIKTSKGTRVARPSVGEDERYRLNMGQQPRGLSAYDANAKLSRDRRKK